MSSTNQSSAATQPLKSKTIVNCNFRTAGRFSNEDARALSTLHEAFARLLAGTLDAYLGSEIEIKLENIDRVAPRECVEGISPQSYVVPMTMSGSDAVLFAAWDNALVLPILELLMGGAGTVQGGEWEASEIEEELLADVMELMARQGEAAWNLAHESLSVKRRVKATALEQLCAPKEKVAVIRFEAKLGAITGSLQIVLSAPALGVLIRQSRAGNAQRRGNVRHFPTPSIRERILDCDMEVTSELQNLRVAVRDLVELQPGSVLKLRAPIQQPGMLTAGGRGVFEAVPVRTGTQRAAQLGRRTTLADWK